MKYRKKPVVIEAMQVPNVGEIDAQRAFDDWIKQRKGDRRAVWVGRNMVIRTLEGEMTASPGDWIICGVKGEIYPCRADIFAETYEMVGEEA